MSRISALNGPSALENVNLEQNMKETLNNMSSANENPDSDHSGSTSHMGSYCTSKIPLQRTVVPPSSLPTTAAWEANAPGMKYILYQFI